MDSARIAAWLCDGGAHMNPRTEQWHKATQRNRAIIAGIKAGPCVDCGHTFPKECMDFDHRDRTDKKNIIARMQTASLERLWAELAKCDLVCSNCHRIRTATRGWVCESR